MPCSIQGKTTKRTGHTASLLCQQSLQSLEEKDEELSYKTQTSPLNWSNMEMQNLFKLQSYPKICLYELQKFNITRNGDWRQGNSVGWQWMTPCQATWDKECGSCQRNSLPVGQEPISSPDGTCVNGKCSGQAIKNAQEGPEEGGEAQMGREWARTGRVKK